MSTILGNARWITEIFQLFPKYYKLFDIYQVCPKKKYSSLGWYLRKYISWIYINGSLNLKEESLTLVFHLLNLINSLERYWQNIFSQKFKSSKVRINNLDRLQHHQGRICMARALSFLIRYFSNYYTLHRSDLAARAAPLDPRLTIFLHL